MDDDDLIPDDGRLDQRRIRSTVLEYQVARRRQRWPWLTAAVLAYVAFGTVMMFGDFAATHQWAAAVECGLIAIVCGFGSARAFAKAVRQLRNAEDVSAIIDAKVVLPPPDFTGLGGGPTLAEKLGQLADEPPRE